MRCPQRVHSLLWGLRKATGQRKGISATPLAKNSELAILGPLERSTEGIWICILPSNEPEGYKEVGWHHPRSQRAN